MAKNDFKAFATDRSANVMSQEEWEALPALLSGFTAGKASSAQVNKVIRQASFIAAALAQFVSDKTQRDVLDNGDLPGFVELLGSGFAVEYLSRKNPFGDIKSDGTVQTALENLGLGEGSALPVGVPVPYPLATPPTGWMKCNGSSFNKTLLPALAAVYPSGVLPDLRGEFIRGWDDGRGVDVGRALMSAQGDAIRNISGTVRIVSNSYNQNTARQMTGAFGWSEASAGDTTNFVLTAASNTSGYKNGGFTFDASSQVPTALENRPRNIAFNYIVRTA
ncbi:TPA: tail fiber protein [Escherichia coli]|uniref:phage tail protein n=1 Tax=Escherichia coli TaxID=562 RepID=UPI000994392F|nr:phage tail protein [Escherichia coli]AQV19709.1 phage tail protein [Escherichia coli]MCS0895108.1 phage tail protein [Escherichia coli]HAJ2688622.1 tail fiber protein [Escherichia coli]HAJ2694197.1 tail fiber protein [Escherichia coli]HAJ2699500.1 tail fiber protein [Escherichia coli]